MGRASGMGLMGSDARVSPYDETTASESIKRVQERMAERREERKCEAAKI